ncbi:MAG TPA: DUF402 domain-containing protein [Terriglobales bacterium]|nr:DUF402 domain-containing protein [Terriglobales bacterium]
MKIEFTISKCDHLGKEVFRYLGQMLKREANSILLEATFGLENVTIVDIPMTVGDVFLETYFLDRWFNIYEIHSKGTNQLKGWYCNISYPAEITENKVIFRDLALDLLVYPDGRQVVLDEDEFAALELTSQDRTAARLALAELQRVGPAALTLK